MSSEWRILPNCKASHSSTSGSSKWVARDGIGWPGFRALDEQYESGLC
jgi:hypothetical protein